MSGQNSPHIMEGRAFQETLMTATCTITRNSEPIFLRSTNRSTFVTTLQYTGMCKIRIAAASAGISEREPLGQQLAVQESILSLPVEGNSHLVAKNDIVTITSNADDDALIGRKFRVKKFPSQSTATARRFIVEEVE